MFANFLLSPSLGQFHEKRIFAELSVAHTVHYYYNKYEYYIFPQNKKNKSIILWNWPLSARAPMSSDARKNEATAINPFLLKIPPPPFIWEPMQENVIYA